MSIRLAALTAGLAATLLAAGGLASTGATPGASTPAPAGSRHADRRHGLAGVRWGTDEPQAADTTTAIRPVPVRYRAAGSHPVRSVAPPLGPGFGSGHSLPRPRGRPRPHAVACRTADRLSLSLAEQPDTDRGHRGHRAPGGGTGHGRLTVTADGVPVADAAGTGSVTATVAEQAHRYRIEQAVPGFGSAGTVRSTYTVASAAGAGAPLPAGWRCAADGADPRVVPLLTLTAPLPVTADGTVPARASFVAAVGHLPGVTAVPVTGLTAATSIDGAGYRPAPVTALGHGRYRVTLPAAATGTAVSLRLATTDAAGSTLTRTLTNAYRVA
ncbi:hypothetical protein [Actinocatenispora sera]|uniref:hypothetical protein n=1 Tax=Actinocatenispora sera TaxID=390989 RepID=UPI0012EDD0A0|nr:hypothetical protein [Actinocatenispora sera]